MWIEPAFAQTTQQPGGDIFGLLVPMILIFGIMYFLLIRPQQKKHKQHQQKLSAVKRGDKVITGGGIYGTVRRVGDEGRLTVEIAKDVQIEVATSTLADVLLKTEPQAAGNDQKSSGGLLGGLMGGKKPEAQPEPSAPETQPKKPKAKKKAKKVETVSAEAIAAEAAPETSGEDATTEAKSEDKGA